MEYVRWNNNNCAQYKVLKIKVFSLIYVHTLTFYNTPTGYITKKQQTNTEPKKDSV